MATFGSWFGKYNGRYDGDWFGAVTGDEPEPEPEVVIVGGWSDHRAARAMRIHMQNRAIIAAVTAMAASGVIQ